MQEKKDQSKYSKINRFLDALGQNFPRSESDADDFLIEIGLDPMRIANEGSERVRKMLGRQTLSIAKASRQEALAEMKTRLSQIHKNLKGTVQEKFAELMASPEYAAQLHFRNIESLPEQDKEEILSERELIKMLKELEDADNKKAPNE